MKSPMTSGIQPKGTPKVAANTFVKSPKPKAVGSKNFAGGGTAVTNVKGTK